MLLGLQDFPEKNSKSMKVRIVPVGARFSTSPIYDNNAHTLQKTMVFHLFFLIEQFLSHVCGDIAYSAQGRPRVAYVNFMIYINFLKILVISKDLGNFRASKLR